MVDFSFPACGNCIHMQVVDWNGENHYYCPFVVDDIPNGLVDPTFDAFKCIREGRFVSKHADR